MQEEVAAGAGVGRTQDGYVARVITVTEKHGPKLLLAQHSFLSLIDILCILRYEYVVI